MAWEPRQHRAEWWASYRRVQAYITDHGYPTQRTVAADGWRLGKWLARQKDRWDTLADEQREALRALPGFARDARQAHFKEMVAICRRAVEAGVNLDRDKNATFEGYPVGQWEHDLWRGRTRMTPERQALLRERLWQPVRAPRAPEGP